MKVKAKHDRFIAEYLVDQNATQAARRAGYKRAHQTGSDLLTIWRNSATRRSRRSTRNPRSTSRSRTHSRKCAPS